MSVSKSLKPIVIGVAVIAALAIILVLFLVVFPEKPAAEPVETPEATALAETVYVIQEDSDRLVRMTAHYDTGDAFTVNYSKDENGKYSYATEPSAKFFEYNTSKFRSMMFTVTNLTAVQLVDEHPTDLSAFGLEEPAFRMELEFDDGHIINILIGDATPVDSYFYMMTDASDSVYTIGNYIKSLISRTELEYRDIPTFPEYTEDDIYANINWVRLTKRGEKPIEIKYDPEFTIEGNKASSMYMMLSPVLSSCSDEKVQTDVLDVVAPTKYEGILKDISGSELAEYGLDNPARLEIGDNAGNHLDIVLGSIVNTHIYAVMGSQYDAFVAGETDELTLLSYESAAFGWFDLDYTTLLNRAVWIQDIHSVASISFEMAGDSYLLELNEYDDKTGSDVDVVRTVGVLNGKEVTETNTKRIFSRTLNLRQVGEIPADTELGEASYVVTLNLRDGGKRVLELIALNERQYACRVDGNAEFYIYKTNINTLVTALERVMDDRNVSLIYNT